MLWIWNEHALWALVNLKAECQVENCKNGIQDVKTMARENKHIKNIHTYKMQKLARCQRMLMLHMHWSTENCFQSMLKQIQSTISFKPIVLPSSDLYFRPIRCGIAFDALQLLLLIVLRYNVWLRPWFLTWILFSWPLHVHKIGTTDIYTPCTYIQCSIVLRWKK